jgi:hypothetical protein
MMKVLMAALAVLALVAPACAPAAPASPPIDVPPSEIPAQTAAPQQPTPVPPTALPPTDVPTATPIGQLFRDDFDGQLQPGWTWENEDPAHWTITDDGWLQIIGADSALLAEGNQRNLLWRDLPAGDFQITARVRAAPTDDFQQATIYMYEDPDNYIALNRGYCSPCTPRGNGIYMEYKSSGQWGAHNATVTETEVFLRLLSQDTVISGYYSLNGTDWTRLGRFGDYFAFKRVGLGVSNVDQQGIDADLLGLFDFFEVTLP